MARELIFKAFGSFPEESVNTLRAWDGVVSVEAIDNGAEIVLDAEPKDTREIAQLRARQLLGVEPDYQGYRD